MSKTIFQRNASLLKNLLNFKRFFNISCLNSFTNISSDDPGGDSSGACGTVL